MLLRDRPPPSSSRPADHRMQPCVRAACMTNVESMHNPHTHEEIPNEVEMTYRSQFCSVLVEKKIQKGKMLPSVAFRSAEPKNNFLVSIQRGPKFSFLMVRSTFLDANSTNLVETTTNGCPLGSRA